MQARRFRRSRYHSRRVIQTESTPAVHQQRRQEPIREEFQLIDRVPLRNPWIAEVTSSSASLSTISNKCIEIPATGLTGFQQTEAPRQIRITCAQPVPTAYVSPPIIYYRDPMRDQYCSLFLQSALVGGVLTGIALIISGITLDTQYGGRLIVLVYIGALLSIVSIILLVIHCCVVIKKTQTPGRASATVKSHGHSDV